MQKVGHGDEGCSNYLHRYNKPRSGRQICKEMEQGRTAGMGMEEAAQDFGKAEDSGTNSFRNYSTRNQIIKWGRNNSSDNSASRTCIDMQCVKGKIISDHAYIRCWRNEEHMDNSEDERRALEDRFYQIYRPLQKQYELRYHMSFDIFGNDLIEIWEYEMEKKGRRICKVEEDTAEECFRRAIDYLEEYKRRKGKRYGQRKRAV